MGCLDKLDREFVIYLFIEAFPSFNDGAARKVVHVGSPTSDMTSFKKNILAQ